MVNTSKQINTAPTNVLLHEPKTKNRRKKDMEAKIFRKIKYMLML